MHGPTPTPAERRHRVELLRRRLDLLGQRYDRSTRGPDTLDRLEMSAARDEYRAQVLRQRVVELTAEIERLEQTSLGYLAGIEALLSETIDRIETEHGQGWSPTAIRGYRMWNVIDGRLCGVVEPWTTRSKVAVCLNHRPGEDIPHSDGRCGPPACGIYSTKQPETAYHQMARRLRWALGIVEMEGKVVEHTLGYRAQKATIAALCLVAPEGRINTAEPETIDRLLADPIGTVSRHGTPNTASTDGELELAARYLTNHPESTPWTSANKSA